MFLTLAAAFAVSRGVYHLVTGVCQTDYSGYPDCRHDTIQAVEVALRLGVDDRLRISTPLMFITKAETVKLAKGLPGCWEALANSHTCYAGQRPPCGKCPACLLREKGFKEAGEVDPLLEV